MRPAKSRLPWECFSGCSGEWPGMEIDRLSPPAGGAWPTRSIEIGLREIMQEIYEAATAARVESLIASLGPVGARTQNPESRPGKIKKSPAPSSMPCGRRDVLRRSEGGGEAYWLLRDRGLAGNYSSGALILTDAVVQGLDRQRHRYREGGYREPQL